jgi:murein DD-endopeptidase MepM/ murein hydrolase activator NlpD
MRRAPRHRRAWPVAFAAAWFAAGVVVGWLARSYGPPGVNHDTGTKAVVSLNTKETKTVPAIVATSGTAGKLRLPIDGVDVESMKGGFAEHRPGHEHEAVDILAPRNTPVHAVEDGTIAKLFFSKGGGGNTIYQFDPTGTLCYYYAHLERYADGLHDGQSVSKGDVIGYVGTSGNAPPNTPHLHFAVFELGDDKSWWKGQAIDPYPFLRDKIKG